MSDQTTVPAAGMPPIATGEQLYDLIMAEVDPRLMSGNIEATKKMIMEATPEERVKFAQELETSFAAYDALAKEEQQAWAEQFHAYKREVMRGMQMEERSKDEQTMHTIESQISDTQS